MFCQTNLTSVCGKTIQLVNSLIVALKNVFPEVRPSQKVKNHCDRPLTRFQTIFQNIKVKSFYYVTRPKKTNRRRQNVMDKKIVYFFFQKNSNLIPRSGHNPNVKKCFSTNIYRPEFGNLADNIRLTTRSVYHNRFTVFRSDFRTLRVKAIVIFFSFSGARFGIDFRR